MIFKFFQKGFNYSQDGPGNRLVYHCQGCNIHCPWCSNPEGLDFKRKSFEKDTQEIIKEIISCKPMFFDNGGVTFTGGEATMQIEAISEIMTKVKDYSVSTAIETNATCPQLKKLIGLCDYWIIDFKSPLKDRLFNVTGANIDTIKNNILEVGKNCYLHLRIPFVHNFNDDEISLKGFIDFFKSLQESEIHFDVEILPYHEYGKEKWENLGLKYQMENGYVSKNSVKAFTNLLIENNIKTINT